MKRYVVFLILICLFVPNKLFAKPDTLNFEAADTVKIELDIFNGEEPLAINLYFDIRHFKKKKYQGKYQPATVTFYSNDSLLVEKKIKIKARGNFRRSHCVFPPFWLNIKKKDLSDTSLYEYKKLKVVSHCKSVGSYPQYILKEYLVYKMYNVITDYSFRARLFKINYIDISKKDKKYSAWAIITEPEQMLADRMNYYVLKSDKIGIKMADTLHTDVLTFFHYMIGNHDFSVAGRHNIKLLIAKVVNQIYPIPVPYDFDYCGFVNASYALPGENLDIKSVTDRYYLGVCRTEEEYDRALQVLVDKKPELIQLIEEFEYLDSKTKTEALDYIHSFFDMLEPRNDFYKNKILPTCR